MLLAKLSYVTPGGKTLEVVTGADTAEMYLKMGYELVEEYEDGWLPEDMAVAVEAERAAEELDPELPDPGPAAVDSKGGSQADDNQEGTD